jgi:hypothetical protein
MVFARAMFCSPPQESIKGLAEELWIRAEHLTRKRDLAADELMEVIKFINKHLAAENDREQGG